ncbi:hypothetical Protein YC6258_05661 [Gynuella sunshinyii YC6258]|uniref:Uncharacterized protein n=1 Tax=Gynuella sunshinyii YC6258 TaxID=1445510 RepID=A0A0C5W510_9GAMM|nr:hypothetical Protein YC6258_05661 [Gynuella sunshinyii YC6258]
MTDKRKKWKKIESRLYGSIVSFFCFGESQKDTIIVCIHIKIIMN